MGVDGGQPVPAPWPGGQCSDSKGEGLRALYMLPHPILCPGRALLCQRRAGKRGIVALLLTFSHP